MSAAHIETNTPVCTGCRICEIACSLRHLGEVRPEAALLYVTEDWDRGLYKPHICQLCPEPACVEACGFEALSTASERGNIVVDQDLCTGCEACVAACKYDAIRWSQPLQRLLVCDMCGGNPACLPFCRPGALYLPDQSQGEVPA